MSDALDLLGVMYVAAFLALCGLASVLAIQFARVLLRFGARLLLILVRAVTGCRPGSK